MKVGLDARFLSKIDQGTASYTSQLVKEFSSILRNDELILLNKNNIQQWGNEQNINHGKLQSNFTPFNVLYGYRRAEQKHRLDILHTNYLTSIHKSRTKKIITIHDILFRTHAEFFPPKLRLGVNLLSKLSLPKADHIITVSEYSKSKIEEFYPFLKNKVSVIYEAASSDFFYIKDRDRVRSQIAESFGIKNQYILFVGRFAPIKNIEVLVDWFCDRYGGKNTMKLVLVGRMDPAFPSSNLEKLIFSNPDICVLSDICNKSLNLLYNGARFFYFASHGEGFGLPILESMATGCPVLTSDKTSCPEVAGDAGMLVDSRDRDAIFASLDNLAKNDKLLSDMSQAGFLRAKEFSWKKCALDTYDLYKKIIDEGSYTA